MALFKKKKEKKLPRKDATIQGTTAKIGQKER